MQFDIFFGPWTYPHLPLHPGVPPSSLPPLPPSNARRNPYKAELSLHPRSVAIEHYGRRLRIAPPVLSHAAIMNFFARVDKLLVRVQMVGNVTNIGNGNQITPEQNRVIVFQPSKSEHRIPLGARSVRTLEMLMISPILVLYPNHQGEPRGTRHIPQ
jgi:hypothetical protein